MPEQKQPSPEEMKAMKEKIKNMSPEELKEFQKKQCIFCQIIEGKIQAKKVYEDERSIGILDINPANPGHILLLPKEHYSVMPQIPEKEVEHLFMVAKFLSNAVLKTLEATGTNIVVANGPAAGQRAQHFMIHVIPRKEGDGIEFTLPQKKHSDDSLKTVAETVRGRLAGLLKVKKEALVKPAKKQVPKIPAPKPAPIKKVEVPKEPKPVPVKKIEPKIEAPKPAVEAEVVKEKPKKKPRKKKKKKQAAPQINVIVKPGAEVKVEAKEAKVKTIKKKPKKSKPKEQEEPKEEKKSKPKKAPKEKPPKESQDENVTLDDITKVLGI
jgi:histidine triad (HIT) family protein